MIVPIDFLKPILDALLGYGRPNRPPRPWLGLYAAKIEDRIVVIGLADRGPAQRAGLRAGDVVRAIGGGGGRSLAGRVRRNWAPGLHRGGIPTILELDRPPVRQTVASPCG